MNKISNTYRNTSLLLLVIIVSHLFVFHFELEEKVLCIGEGNHSHVENLSDSCLGNQYNITLTTDECTIQNIDSCTDLLLDNHVDENLAKINRTIHYKFVQIVDLNRVESNKTNTSKRKNLNSYIVQKYITEHLPTTLLLI